MRRLGQVLSRWDYREMGTDDVGGGRPIYNIFSTH